MNNCGKKTDFQNLKFDLKNLCRIYLQWLQIRLFLQKVKKEQGGKKINTFHRGGTMPSRWKVPPVMVIGEVNYPT